MSDWVWEYEGYEPAEERLRESLCTLGNGYVATRGAAPETTADEVHYPGTYAAGCYNRLVSTVAGRQVENEDMVNLPNWLPLRYRIHDPDRAPGGWLSPDGGELAGYRQTLDLRHGTLLRRLRFTGRDATLDVEQHRLVHMGIRIWRRCGPLSGPRADRARSRSNPRSTARWPTRAWPATAGWLATI